MLLLLALSGSLSLFGRKRKAIGESGHLFAWLRSAPFELALGAGRAKTHSLGRECQKVRLLSACKSQVLQEPLFHFSSPSLFVAANFGPTLILIPAPKEWKWGLNWCCSSEGERRAKCGRKLERAANSQLWALFLFLSLSLSEKKTSKTNCSPADDQ